MQDKPIEKLIKLLVYICFYYLLSKYKVYRHFLFIIPTIDFLFHLPFFIGLTKISSILLAFLRTKFLFYLSFLLYVFSLLWIYALTSLFSSILSILIWYFSKVLRLILRLVSKFCCKIISGRLIFAAYYYILYIVFHCISVQNSF